MSIMARPHTRYVSRGHDSFHGQEIAPAPISDQAIPMIDLFLLSLSLTLLTAVLTFGIRI